MSSLPRQTLPKEPSVQKLLNERSRSGLVSVRKRPFRAKRAAEAVKQCLEVVSTSIAKSPGHLRDRRKPGLFSGGKTPHMPLFRLDIGGLVSTVRGTGYCFLPIGRGFAPAACVITHYFAKPGCRSVFQFNVYNMHRYVVYSRKP